MPGVRQSIMALSVSFVVASPLVARAIPQALPAPPAVAVEAAPSSDSFEGLLDRAQRFTQAERHQEALSSWQAAYALRQRPGLLLEIARSQQRLDLGREAADSYRRFLVSDPNPPSALKSEAEQGILRLDRLAQPVPQAMRQELRELMPYKVIKRRYHNGMRTGGITMFAIGYAAALISGLVMGPIFINSSGSDSKAIGTGSFLLIIPVAGPFLSGIVTPAMAARTSSSDYYYSSSNASNLALAWTLPWLLTSGALQVAGVGMWAGAYRHPQNVVVPNAAEVSWNLTPYANLNGGGMAATVTF